MKKKALVVVLLCAFGIAAFSVGIAGAVATPPWYNCTVKIVGTLPTFYFMQVTDVGGAFTDRFFLIDAADPQAKSYLASALTGYASGGLLSLYLPDTTQNAFAQGVTAGQQ